ncbi:MAG TPA: hypothetical protein VN610_00510 [Bryobacteraceae bacterium]|nr:hypothetical protein [Bryobacteraceae bacterium]
MEPVISLPDWDDEEDSPIGDREIAALHENAADDCVLCGLDAWESEDDG